MSTKIEPFWHTEKYWKHVTNDSDKLHTPRYIVDFENDALWENGQILMHCGKDKSTFLTLFLPTIPGLPTFRNCLEGETSSAKRKNPQVGSRPAHGSRGKTLERGPRQRPPCVRKFVGPIWWGKFYNFKPFSSLNLSVYIIWGCKGGLPPCVRKFYDGWAKYAKF